MPEIITIEITENTLPFQFKELIQKLSQKTQQRVVILIDEYDKPILDNITETEIAIEMRNGSNYAGAKYTNMIESKIWSTKSLCNL